MPLTEYWDRKAALDACCAVVRACVPEIDPAAVYQGDLQDLPKARPGCRVYQVSEPVERAWTDSKKLTKQAQVWLVTVNSAVEGDPSTITVLDAPATYVALAGDDAASIRAEELTLLGGLGKPITVAAVGAASLRITGTTAGQHLGVKVTENMTAELEADNLHEQGLMPSFWTARFEFEEQPGVDGTASRAPAWATRLRGWLQMGKGDEALRAAALDFNTVVFRGNTTRPDRGKTTVIEMIDVQFSAIQGLGDDVSSIDSFGTAPTLEVSNAP